jgi:hypothetical protein
MKEEIKLAGKIVGIFILVWALILLAFWNKATAQSRDTTICQTWKIQTGLNQFALKDTCWTLKISGGGNVVSDTIWLTNNVLYRGEKGDKGEPGANGICPSCPGGGGGSGIFESGWLNVQDYGANPNDSQDDTEAILRAIAAAKASGGYKIYFPAANSENQYIVSRTINFTGNFASWQVKGGGISDNARSQDASTVIRYTGKSGPCFNFVAVRLSKVSDLVFVGGNARPLEIIAKHRNDTISWNPANWVSVGYSIDRYDAHSAIAWDYKQDGPPWSAQVVVENVKVEGFVVGFNISPTQGNMQADTYAFYNCKHFGVTYAYSINQDQARSVSIIQPWVDGSYSAFVNNRFGKGNGSAFNVFGGQVTTTFRVFECTNAYRGNAAITGLFTEACGILGTWSGLGVNNNAIAFTGCEFGMDNNGFEQDKEDHWVTPMTFFQTGANVTFTGCNFNYRKDLMGIDLGDGFVQFNGCSFGDLRKFFFSNAANVSFTGRSTYRTNPPEESFYPEDIVSISGNQRYYVRPEIKAVHVTQNIAPYKQLRNASAMVPSYFSVFWRELPNEKEFTVSLTQSEADNLRVGDHIETTVKNAVPNMGTSFGGAQVPGLKITAINGTSVTFKKIAPEVQVSWTGSVYTPFSTFIGKAKSGDIVNDGGTIRRLKEGESGGVSVFY